MVEFHHPFNSTPYAGRWLRDFRSILSPKRRVPPAVSLHNVTSRMAPWGQLATRLALSGKPR
jgi:hypothetical protein